VLIEIYRKGKIAEAFRAFFNQPTDSLELVENLGSLPANREAVNGDSVWMFYSSWR
jgi:hypothetical protein